MTIYNLGNIKGEKGDKGDSITGPTGPIGVGIKSIEQITYRKFKFCLTDGSEYIMDYSDEPSFDGITITSDKDIISTGETATITAQLTSQGQPASISGETVTFEVRKQSDDSLIETLSDVTDSGVATVSYLGKHTGDLYIRANCMLLSETCTLEDLWYYKPTLDNDFTRTTDGNEHVYSLNTPIELPSEFEIKFTTSRSSTSNGVVYIEIGDNVSHSYDIGALRNKGSLSIRRNSDGTLLVDKNNDNVIPLAETENVYVYQNSMHSITSSSTTLTANEVNATLGKFLAVKLNTYCNLKEIKIKQL